MFIYSFFFFFYNFRRQAGNTAAGVPASHQVSVASDEEIQKLVAMGFEKVKLHHPIALTNYPFQYMHVFSCL
jgi:hypothetical protein